MVSYEEPDMLRNKLADLLGLGDDRYGKDLTDIFSHIIKYTPNVWSPNYLNYLYSSPDPVGLLGDWLVSLLNTNVHAYEASPVLTLVEIELIKTLAKTIGYPSDSDGVFCPGGSYSNMYAMYLARKKLIPDTGRDSLGTYKKPVVFTSEHSHYSIDKASSLLGIGTDFLRKITCDKYGRMVPENLKHEIDNAIASGEQPFFVNATIGTTVLGAFDPLNKIKKISSEYKLWLHVDAAWGGAAFLLDERRHMFQGIEQADSVTWDFHKAMKSPILCSALLIKEGYRLANPFNVDASYLLHNIDGKEVFNTGIKTPQCGRRGDAFKFWLMWKVKGKKYFSEQVKRRFNQTAELIDTIKQRNCFRIYDDKPDFWNVCFWYIPGHLRNVTDISRCSNDEKLELEKLTINLYQCMKKDGQVMVNYAKINNYPAFIRLITGNQLGRDNIVKILDIIESIGDALSLKLSEILISGGDSRLELNGQNRNYIMVSPKPACKTMVSRSSCTGSFISEENYEYLDKLLRDIRSAKISFQESMDNVHRRIRAILKLDSNTSIVTIPSGTDSEYIPLLVAKAFAGHDYKIVNVITAAGEIGSHSATAAGGLYFSSYAPNRTQVQSGERLGGIGENIEVVTISHQGLSETDKKGNNQWINYTRQNLSQPGEIALLHIVDSSKLGRRMDIIEEVESLRNQFPGKLLVVIDSCQSRTDASRTRYYLKLGYMVMITGSKFEEGPPFSGAVIVPTALTNSLNKSSFTNLLSGLKNYITKYDVSGDIKMMIHQHLPAWMNLGLLMRWSCGLNNWEKFQSIEESQKVGMIQQWVEGIIQMIKQYPNIELYGGGERQPGAVGEVNTIISFKLISGKKPLQIEDLRKVYLWLNRDMRNVLPSDVQAGSQVKNILKQRFLIGQPVDLGQFAVLRIALGATLACQLDQYGPETVLSEDRALLEKINLLLTYFPLFDIQPEV